MNLGFNFRDILKVIKYLTFNVLTRGLSRHVNWSNVSTRSPVDTLDLLPQVKFLTRTLANEYVPILLFKVSIISHLAISLLS